MKNVLTFMLLSMITVFSLSAQGIRFEENHDLNAALTRAKAENKLVFIDAYAEWCGPCKVMARDIFPLKETGDFFNANFINLKLDMEKGPNVEIAKKYEVRAYPTYLFLNAEGELVHKGLGSMPADKFIELARNAADNENNYSALSRKIKNGDLSLSTVKKFLAQNPYDNGNGALVDKYFQSLSESQIFTEENWELFDKYISDISSVSFRYFLENRERIAGFAGKNKVDQKITKTLAMAYYQDPSKEETLRNTDPVLFAEAKKKVDMSKVYSKFLQKKDDKEAWNNLWKVAVPILNVSENPDELNSMAWMVYENYKKFNDKNTLASALGWAKKAWEKAPEKDMIADTYAHLLFESGKKKDALKVENKALEMATKAQNAEAIENYKTAIAKFKNKK